MVGCDHGGNDSNFGDNGVGGNGVTVMFMEKEKH